MSAYFYDRIVNICMVTAVVSALLFERAGDQKLIVGSIGALAAVVSGITYFYNQWHLHEVDKREDE